MLPLDDTKQFKFVGRENEVSTVRRAIDAADGGSGQIITIVGEAGAGKTRLAVEASEHAKSQGHLAVIGRCREISGAPAYWPWSQILRKIAESTGLPVPEEFRSFVDVSSSASTNDPEPETRAFLAHEAVSRYLDSVAMQTPLFIWIEDVHWADSASLNLLEFISGDVSSSRMSLLITRRDPENTSSAVHSALGEIARLPNHSPIQLPSLSRHAIGELIVERDENLATSGVIDQMLDKTGGNALYVTELIRLMTESEYSENDGPLDILGTPGPVAQILASRLDTLSARTVELLESAAVLGRAIDLDEVTELVQANRDSVARDLEHAVSIGIVTVTRDQPSRFEFSHELVRIALLNRLDRARSAELNLAAARLRESVGDDELQAIAGTLAHHYERASSLVGDPPAIEYLILAGEYAISRLSYPEAVIHLEKALKLLLPGAIAEVYEIATLSPSEVPESPLSHRKLDDQTERCLRAYARSLAGTNQGYHACIVNKVAFDYLVENGRLLEASEIATLPLGEWSNASRAMYESALTFAPKGSVARVTILSKMGTQFASTPDSDYESAVEYLEQAVADAKNIDDPLLLAWCLGRLGMVHTWFYNWSEGARLSTEAASVADDTDDLECRVHAYLWSTMALLTLGDKESARKYAGKALQTAIRSKHKLRLWQGNSAQAAIDIQDGQLGRVIERFRDLDDTESFRWSYMNRIIALAHLGRDTDAMQQTSTLRRKLEDSPRQWGRGATIGAAFVRIAVDLGLELVTRPEITELLMGEYPIDQLSFDSIPSWIGKGYYGIAYGDDELVQHAYELTLPHAGIVYSQMFSSSASTDRVLGKFAQHLGRTESARNHFDDAVKLLRKGDYKFELGWTCHDFAHLLTDQMEYDRAEKLIAEGLVIAGECELVPLATKLYGLEATISAARTGTLNFGLTVREVEVLKLLAAGLTNREIAEKLIVTSNTIGTHVKSIYAKTGCSNRAEATRIATVHGLVSERV